MKRFLCCGILTASMIAGHAHAQTNVYSLNVVSYVSIPMPTIKSAWQIGPQPFNLGYTVTSWDPFIDGREHTEIFIGPHGVKVRGDVSGWLIKGGCVLLIWSAGAFFWIITTPRFRAKEEETIIAERPIESS